MSLYNVYEMSTQSLAYHAAKRFKYLLASGMLPGEIIDRLEEEVIPALEYIDGWEPSDDDIKAHIESHGLL
jgi:hypothetical protein